MGLDILIRTDLDDQVFTVEYRDSGRQHFQKHSLSRTFCNLMCRQHVISGEPELDQIARLFSIDVSPLYAMDLYGNTNGEALEVMLENVSSAEERQSLLDRADQAESAVAGNIGKVLGTVTLLIHILSAITDLPQRLNDYGHDTLVYDQYFTDFNVDKGDGYIHNNFGQDLRNFQRFLEYAKSKGAATVYFNYG